MTPDAFQDITTAGETQPPPLKAPRRGVFILPNMLTTASLLAGFLGIIWSIGGNYEQAAVAILVSCLLDGLDGSVARLTRTTSEFGVQLDSLADLVAFGVGPAILVYLWQLQPYGRLGIMASFLLIACGALRLARFNVQTKTSSKLFFTGLPIPAQGCTLATLVLFAPYLPERFAQSVLPMACLVLVYGLSFLMVSRVRYASFKEYGAIKAHPFSSMVTAILIFVLVASEPKLLGFLFFLGYIVSGPVYTFIILPRRHPKILRESPQDIS
jgi:CDP-diacylglycerol--serine O-phosphatidyltransferase